MEKILLRGRGMPSGLKKCFRLFQLTVAFFLIGLMQVSASVYSETTKLTLELRNKKVVEVLEEIEKQSEFRFAYSAELIDVDRRVTVSLNGKTIDEVLDVVFEGTGVEHATHDRHIMLYPKAMDKTDSKVDAEQKTVTGTVTDDRGEPLPGVTVLIKGTTTGTVTNIDGVFNLGNISADATLIFSFVGMQSQEIVVGTQTTINVRMKVDAIGIEEVVAIGYGTMDKKELTASVTHVGSKDFLNTATTNPVMQIQGKVAGVSVQKTAASDPNASESIQIRGAGSRSAGNGPLVVINGIPGGDLKNIDDNDIESIDVLKGGAAAAIYGTRAANGVIIVTTKTGSTTGQMKVEYNGYVSTDQIKNSPELLSADEFLELGIARDEGARTDWNRELVRSTPVSHNHSVALSSGNAQTQYRASVQYRDYQGIDIASEREEYGARVNIHHTALDKLLEFDLGLAPRFVKEKYTSYGAWNQAMQLNPTIPVMNPNNPSQFQYISGWDTWNPVEKLTLDEDGAERKYFMGNGKVKLNILPNLNTSLMYAFEKNDRAHDFYTPSNSTDSQNNNRRGAALKEYQAWNDQVVDWLTNYTLEKDDLLLKAMAGYSYQYHVESSFYARNYDFPSDALSYNDLDQGSYLREGRAYMDSHKESYKIIAFFGRLSTSYLDKYFLTGSLRYEGSSKFGENNKWGWFPGVSAGWRISNESFMDSQEIFDDLKLRADFGITGNQGFAPYQAQRLYSGAGNYYMFSSWVKGFGPGNNYNPNLAWEKSVNFNFGVDFAILDNRIGGSLEFYDRTSKDLLGQYDVAVPPNIHEQTWVNVGTIKNQGVELSLNGIVAQTNDFEYSINAVAAYNKNWLVSFSDGQYEQGQVFLKHLPSPGNPGPVILLEEGGDIGSFYLFKHAGFDENGNFLIYKKGADGSFTDEVIPAQGAGDENKYHAGSGVPKVTASLSNTFRYKNFDATLYFRGAFGHEVLNLKNMYYGLKAFEGVNLLRKAYFPGDGIQTHEINDTKKVTDYFLQRGDWVKLDVVTLGYTFDTPGTIDNLRIYLSGRNMFTFTKYDGVDPELAPVNGLEPGVEEKEYYPITRTFTLGVQVAF